MDDGIIYEGELKNEQKFYLRYPRMEDLEKLLDYINTLSSEQTFIRYQGEQLTLEQERDWLQKLLDSIEAKKCVQLLVFVDGKLAGDSQVGMRDLVESHVGSFGISLAKKFRGLGLGKILMEQTLKETVEKLPSLKIVTLSCFANNEVALSLYKSLGFKEYGKLPEGLIYKGEFKDQIYMYKKSG